MYPAFKALKRFRGQTPFIQSLVVPYLADVDFLPNGIVADLIQEKSPLPGMTLAAYLVQRALSVKGLGIKVDQLAPEVRNVFQGLGLIAGQKTTSFDQIGDALRNRYAVVYWRRWKRLFGDNYQHALELLLSAEARYQPDRSGWLSFQNSFNDAMFRAFMKYLQNKGLTGVMTMIDPKGKLHTFGRLLDKDHAFAKAHPGLAASLRAGNDRRNSIPASHPFETKGGHKTRPLRVKERDALRKRFATVYSEIIKYVNAQRFLHVR